MIAPRKRDIDALCEVLPGAIGFRLSELGIVGDDDLELVVEGSTQRGDALVLASRKGVFSPKASLDVVVAWLVMTRLSTGEAPPPPRGGPPGTARWGHAGCCGSQPTTHLVGSGLATWDGACCSGVEPCARPAYPVAREVKDAAFERISLRIALRERVQIVRGYGPRSNPTSTGHTMQVTRPWRGDRCALATARRADVVWVSVPRIAPA